MEIYVSKYQRLNFIEQEHLIECYFMPESLNMEDEDYREEAQHFMKLVSKYQPQKIYLDFRELFFPVSPEIQEWFYPQLHTTLLKSNTQKMAIIVSKDMVAQLATEQIVDEIQAQYPYNVSYFKTPEEARAWLSEQYPQNESLLSNPS